MLVSFFNLLLVSTTHPPRPSVPPVGPMFPLRVSLPHLVGFMMAGSCLFAPYSMNYPVDWLNSRSQPHLTPGSQPKLSEGPSEGSKKTSVAFNPSWEHTPKEVKGPPMIDHKSPHIAEP